jgi:hypothetical protein
MVLVGCQPKTKNEVAMACEWVLYGSQRESFVFNLDKKEVYWVNENKRYPINELNEGRITFQGVRSSLLVGDNKYQNDVPIKFIVNRVTGELYIEGIKTPSGYNNRCVTSDKVI